MNSITPGYKSTEAWSSLLASIFVMINLPPAQSSVIVAGISGLPLPGPWSKASTNETWSGS
jgi:hypothetical protein